MQIGKGEDAMDDMVKKGTIVKDVVLAEQVNLKCYSTGERRRLYKESGEKYGEFSQRSTGK